MQTDLKDIKKILIVKLRYIGDTVLLQPVIDNIKNFMPHVHLSVMVNKGTEGILRYHSGIDQLICYDRNALKYSFSPVRKIIDNLKFIWDIRQSHYDLVIDFSQSDRASLITWLSNAPARMGCNYDNPLTRLYFNQIIDADIRAMHVVDYEFKALEQLGISISTRTLKIDVPNDIQKRIDEMIGFSGLEPFKLKVAIHPGARRAARMWPVDSFAALAVRLKEVYGAGIAVITSDKEEQLIEQLQKKGAPIDIFTSHLNLMEMAAFLKRCDLFIGNDTAPAHLAAAVGIKTIALFGPTFPYLWKPYSDQAYAIFSNLKCCGCTQINCPHEGYPCMSNITVDAVWKKIIELLHTYKSKFEPIAKREEFVAGA